MNFIYKYGRNTNRIYCIWILSEGTKYVFMYDNSFREFENVTKKVNIKTIESFPSVRFICRLRKK